MKNKKDIKNIRKNFKVSEAEDTLLKEKMSELGTTNLSEAVRRLIENSKITVKNEAIFLEKIRLLSKVSNNLNQIVKAFHIDGKKSKHVDEKWDELSHQIKYIYNFLREMK